MEERDELFIAIYFIGRFFEAGGTDTRARRGGSTVCTH